MLRKHGSSPSSSLSLPNFSLTFTTLLRLSFVDTKLRNETRSSNHPIPRVINVDKNPAYPAAIRALKREGILPRRVRLRQCKYLNNIVEQDHRSVKKRTWLAKGYGSFQSAWRTLEGIETVNMIRKGRVRWVTKDDVSAQARFVAKLFGIAA